MKNLKTLERLQQLHNLIANENTGTPEELSNLLRISKRSIHSLIRIKGL
jgi:DeoR/GlpR family transcriptional regulator of sugar metabolism